MPDSLRCLYVCYLSLDDPLVHSQVVAYLEGLARRGHTVHLLTFDTPMSDERRAELRADLEAAASPGTRGATTSAPRCPPPSTTPSRARSPRSGSCVATA